MAEQQEFDPRFDPAFQRGYVPPARPHRTPPIPRPEEVVGAPPSVEPQQPEAAHPTEHGQTLPESQPPQELQGDAPVGAVPAIRRGINPYVILLWVVGVVFVLGGVALLFVGFLAVFASGSAGPAQAASAQALYVFGSTFGVPLVTVGLITIVGLILLSAWHSWRRHDGENS